MLEKTSLAILVLLVVFSVAGCGGGRKAIQIKGSDTMVNLGQAWAEDFMKTHPEISVAVTGGGSGTGFVALINGTTDIAQTSRNIKPKEITLAEKRGVKPYEIHVASDGITVVVHPSNSVSRLTLPQLSDIFSGKIKNWKEVGGADRAIVALSRERNSGTHVFFLEEVVKLGKKKNPAEFAPDVLMMPSSQAIVEEVMSNPSAIGYIGFGYLNSKLKALAVAKRDNDPFVAPSIKTIKNKSYPISRSLLFYTNGQPKGKLKEFVDFVLSPKGQEIVLKMDFIPAK
jgi:phosphate transport system substrate-binding protein